MMDTIGSNRGWRIAEAIRRCVDPELLSAWFSVHREWRDEGSPAGRYLWRSEELEGYEAQRHNAQTRVTANLNQRRELAYARILHYLKAQLRAEKLVAWGRRESPMAPHAVIPASAWGDLNISSVSKSKLTEATKQKVPILDVRIFPIVKSPDAVERLAGRTLSDVIRMCVTEDPQIRMLFLRAICAIDDTALVRDHKHARMVWPFTRDKEGSDEKAPDLGASDSSTNSARMMRSTNRLMNDRLEVLIGYLASGALAAEGTPTNSASGVPIERSVWHEPQTFVDLRKGDLLKIEPEADSTALSKPIFTGLILLKPSMADQPQSPSTDENLVPIERPGKAVKRVVSKISAESACAVWLSDLMRADPTIKHHTKGEYWQKALTIWPEKLTHRGFERAWMQAVQTTNAVKWSASGRPKSSQA